MMPTLTYVNMIFIGTFAEVDTDESDADAESADDLLGTYTDLNMVTVGEHDRNDDGNIGDDEFMDAAGRTGEDRDFLDYDVGFGNEEYEIDVTMAATVRVTLGDGSTTDVTVAVLQTTIGDVFIRDVGNNLDNLNIQSLEILSFNNTSYSGSATGNSIQNSSVVCFLDGTRIDTPSGPRPVQDLQVGDMVSTLDRGPQPILWRHHSPVGAAATDRPVRFPAGALGPDLPRRDLWLSPDHRVLARSSVVSRMFGTREVLVPAKRFAGFRAVARDATRAGRHYHHILLPCHSVIIADGLGVESLLPGAQVIRRLPPGPRARLRETLSLLGYPAGLGYLPARDVPRGHKQRRLLWRHARNDASFVGPRKPLVAV